MFSAEIELVDLCRVPWNGVFDSLRGEDIRLYWTHSEELDAWVLNVFSPKNCVLWDVGQFRNFMNGHAEFQRNTLGRKSSGKSVEIMVSAADERPEAVEFLLGSVTGYFGNRYFGKCSLTQYRLAARRQESYLVPGARRDAVEKYFFTQSGWPRAIRKLDEKIQLVVTDESRAKLKGWFRLLAAPMVTLSKEEIVAASAELESEISKGIPELDISIGFPGDISLSIPVLIRDETLLKAFSRLALYRAQVALEVSALSVIERLAFDLDSKGWQVPVLDESRDELKTLLESRFRCLGTVSENPF